MVRRLLPVLLAAIFTLSGVSPLIAGPISTTAPASDAWLMLEPSPPGAESVSLPLALPRLAEAVRDGRLASFAPIQELGAVILEDPSTELLAEALRWEGVKAVLPRFALPPTWRSAAGAETPETDPSLAPGVGAAPAQAESQRLANRARLSGAVGPDNPIVCDITVNAPGVLCYSAALAKTAKLTLLRAGLIRSTIDTVTDNTGYLQAEFSEAILVGDVVRVDVTSEPILEIPVLGLTLSANKPSDTLSGVAPSHAYIGLTVFDWRFGSVPRGTTADQAGNFSMSLGDKIDLLPGAYVWPSYSKASYTISLEQWRVPGVEVYDGRFNDYVYGYGRPGTTVSVELLDAASVVKGAAAATIDTNGYFWARPRATGACEAYPEIVPGDSVTVRVAGETPVNVQVLPAAVTGIDTVADTLSGIVAPTGKAVAYARDDLGGSRHLKGSADAAGSLVLDFAGLLDVAPGSYARVTAYDSADNGTTGEYLYAGPYLRARLNSWADLDVVGPPGTPVTALLRSGSGVIKGSLAGATGLDGRLSYASFAGPAGDDVALSAGDVIEATLGDQALSVTVPGIEVLVDRDAGRVSGKGPASSKLWLVHSAGSLAAREEPGFAWSVTTGSDGSFYRVVGWMAGGYPLETTYRTAAGHDITVFGTVPQFTVEPASDLIYGYATPHQVVTAHLLASDGITEKATSTATAASDGWYWLAFQGADVNIADVVVVDAGPLHFVQPVRSVTLNFDTDTDTISGASPPDGWLNLHAGLEFGALTQTHDDNLYAGASGSYSTNFGGEADLRGGYFLQATYWEDGNRDRVRVSGHVPFVTIDQVHDVVDGYSVPGDLGTVAVWREGVLQASGEVTASPTSGAFSYADPGLDLAPGDVVQVNLGSLVRNAMVMPMNGTLELDLDRATGTSLPSIRLGLSPQRWDGSAFSSHITARSQNLDRIVETTAETGAFAADFGCLADLSAGDHLELDYVDAADNYQRAFAYSTAPSITVTHYPAEARTRIPFEVAFTLAGGVHATSAAVRWDTSPHPFDREYAYAEPAPGSIGDDAVQLRVLESGSKFLRVYARIDGQDVWSEPELTIAVTPSLGIFLPKVSR